MSDLRAHLEETLWEHRSVPSDMTPDGCSGCGWRGSSHRDHLADVLLSLPGITIVDTEAVDQVAKAIFANRRHHEPVKAWEFLYSDEQDSYRAMAQAALLAAANAAEEKS